MSRIGAAAMALALSFAVTPVLAQTAPAPQADAGEVSLSLNFPPFAERTPGRFEVARGLLVVKVQVAGREAWALVDNHSERSLIDNDLATATGLPILPPGQTPRSTTVGRITGAVVPDLPLAIPGQFTATWAGLVADLDPVSSALGREIGFVFGRELLEQVTFALEPATGGFDFLPAGAVTAPDGAAPFLAMAGERDEVELQLAGQAVRASVDLGYPGLLRLSPATWTRLGLPAANGMAPLSLAVIGPLTARDIPVEVASAPAGEPEVVLGMAALGQMRMALDIGAGKLWLAPPGPPPPPLAPAAP